MCSGEITIHTNECFLLFSLLKNFLGIIEILFKRFKNSFLTLI